MSGSQPSEAHTGAVELHAVSKRFDAFTAVDRLDLSIAPGEFLTLLGPSGCGKTTTLRMIAGFEQPTTGQILINGANTTGMPPFKRNVNTVFQNYALFPHLSVRDNVAFGLKMKGVSRTEREQRVREALDQVRLAPLAERRPSQLSGGQQQRVALARALVNRPAVLLLDEPLGALDLKLRKAMQMELAEIQHRVGITFVYVTHDQEEALTMSDRIAVMNEGKLLQLGSAVEIYERPNSRFVAEFIGESNFLEGVITGHEGGMSVVTVDGVGTIRGPGQAPLGTSVVVAIRPEKIVIAHGQQHELNSARATVTSTIFRGSDTQLNVRLSNGTPLTLTLPNQRFPRADEFSAGTEIAIAWEPAATSILLE